jgi:NADPH:quinone reductase-like Zn-dependent oxidoreductase
MKAAVAEKYGGPEVLRIQDLPRPVPKGDQLLVQVRAIGLNFADIFGRFGVYPGTPKPPFIPGIELSGVVVEVGGSVRIFKGGERIMGYSRTGSHAEFVLINEKYATMLPDAMSFEEGAAFLVTFLSAYHGLVRLANTRPGENVLIHAAAGGVGLASIQLAKHLSATVFGTVGTEEKAGIAQQHGAHHVVNYTTHDFAKEIRRMVGRQGIDVVMDSVGGDVYRKSWKLLAQMGRYILYGISAVTGKGALSRLKVARTFSLMKPIFPPNLLSANKGIFGFNLGTLTGKENYFKEAVMELLKLYEKGVLKPTIGKVFSFEQIVEAHNALQTRQTIGKVVVTVG